MAELKSANATYTPDIPDPHRRLALFILLSLLLHVALLFVIRPLTKNPPITRPHPMEVYFSAPPIPVPARIPNKAPTRKHGNPANLIAPPMTQVAPLTTQPEATSPADTPSFFNPQQLMESAKNIARDEARKTEQGIAALEKKKLNTPAASLEQYLRQPHEEILLANGVLKITTSTGAVCFQPVPYFAHDAAGVFGIPTSCP